LNKICGEIQLQNRGSLIVVADTHLGLRVTKRILGLGNTVSCEPQILSDFIEWIKNLERTGKTTIKTINLGAGDVEKRERALKAPEKIVLLGDILELWDAPNRAIDVCSRSIIQSISELRCEKIYLIGNHDYASKGISGKYPLGLSPIQIIEDVYPIQTGSSEDIATLPIGKDKYLFLHGHQFDRTFRSFGRLWEVVSMLRDGAEAFGLYSWLLVSLFLVFLVLNVLHWWLDIGDLILMLSLVVVPRMFISLARPVWNKFMRTRYKREKAVKGFMDWWGEFSKNKVHSSEQNLNIVYGHTHLADVFWSNEIERISNRSIPKKAKINLINIPSWVRDQAKKYEDILCATFLYIDDEGSEFIAWNWNLKCPFYIPKEIIRRRSEGKEITPTMAQELVQIGWPQKLIEEWKKPLTL
jgi:UDP-2,3-diacylglucosamine pyrophosphatase LpxH